MSRSLRFAAYGLILLSGLVPVGCASGGASPKAAAAEIRVLERNAEGQEHRALPKTLEGCKYLGTAFAQAPAEAPPGPYLLDDLKAKAAKQGGNTLVVLPGKPVDQGRLRGSIFLCGGGA